MAKVNPSYDAMKHTGIAAGDDAPAATLAPYDAVKYSGVSTTSQPDGVAAPAPTPDDARAYHDMQNSGGDTVAHNDGPGTASAKNSG